MNRGPGGSTCRVRDLQEIAHDLGALSAIRPAIEAVLA
jgi:hypothetical protein